jgi:hypothetical protein
MCWVRSTTRFASWVAFIALALQIVVSFGHVHLEGIHRAYPANVAGLKAQAQPLPAQQPSEDNDEYCAICATIYLATNSFVAQAPQLPLPFVSQPVEHIARIAVAFITSRRTSFQSRAPPRT